MKTYSNGQVPLLRLENINVRISGKKEKILLKNFNLNIYPGELIVIVGNSGAGKSTLLNIIAGFIRPIPPNRGWFKKSVDWFFYSKSNITMTGKVILNGTDITYDMPWQRDIGLVMQQFSLYSHLTIGENLEFPLKAKRIEKKERERRIKIVLARIGIPEKYLTQPINILSGGQSQRIAIAKTLLKDPKIALFDEAFSNLDPKLRQTFRNTIIQEFIGKQEEDGKQTAVIFVTHNLEDAKKADKIIMMSLPELDPDKISSSDTDTECITFPTNGLYETAWEEFKEKKYFDIEETIYVTYRNY